MKEKGDQAELKACHFLQAKDFKLIEKNFKCQFGEIDLIMEDQNDLVFVEVRSRSKTDYASALESITPSKIRKLIRTALFYLQIKECLYKVHSRFDIITIQRESFQIDWIKNAISVDDFL